MAFTKIKKVLGFSTEEKAISLTDAEAFGLFAATPTAAGILVSPNSAMRVPAVSCAVGLIADTIGCLPAKVYQRDDKQAAKDHPAYKLVHEAANEWTSAEQLRTELTTDALLIGNGYALVTRLRDGTPFELHRIDPANVRTEHAPDGEPFYIVRTSSGDVQHSFQDVLHLQPFGGISPITLGREAIALALAFEGHIGGVFANGGRPSGIIKSPKSLDVEAKKKLAASWFTSHAGQSAGGTAILDEEMDYKQLSMTLADTQFAENRLEQTREIARVFRVPPTMLFELSRGTWSNTEEMFRQFHKVTLKPWLKQWVWAYSRVLLTPEEREAFYIEFITDDLLTTDTAARATAYGQYRAMGALTGNEVRAGLNLPPHDDGNELQNPFTTSAAKESA
ncbi:Phage portal protein [Roseovarius litorisediminis]|uniref:Phage portal protein n=1 Tax=Roseovarius litorisediminis TaxID=1312363 RepID=A0A1Y5TEY9_9RHOB|nr:phage portal protein [Roseovarius litorisediminis]SLN62406.1 Phage portal protein [Roseovarius litorisediminis]